MVGRSVVEVVGRLVGNVLFIWYLEDSGGFRSPGGWGGRCAAPGHWLLAGVITKDRFTLAFNLAAIREPPLALRLEPQRSRVNARCSVCPI